jgi:hypothetical protein
MYLLPSYGNYPFVSDKGFLLSPGRHHFVTMTAAVVDADERIKTLQPSQRNCLFGDETQVPLRACVCEKIAQTVAQPVFGQN